MSEIDWSDEAERREFENSIEVHRAIRKNYSWSQWMQWFCGIMLLPFGMVLTFYGTIAWTIVSDARKEQIDKDERFANMTEDSDNTTVSYIPPGILDTLRLNYYFLTIPCQGMAFIAAVSYHFTDYRKLNLLGSIIPCFCLPVDMLIFYLEPLGFIGTLFALVLGFIPFAIIIADATFPEKVVKVKGLKGTIQTVHKNSWNKHLSLTFNQRYDLVVRMTAEGYAFFATVALVITLLKGDHFPLVASYTEISILNISQRGGRTSIFGNRYPGYRGNSSATGSCLGDGTLAWGFQRGRPVLLHHAC